MNKLDRIPVLITHRDLNGISLYEEFRLVTKMDAFILKLKHGEDLADLTNFMNWKK